MSRIESFSVSNEIHSSKNNIDNQKNLICLSLEKNIIYSLTNGIIPRLNFITDSIFRGISKIWAIKRHHQDVCHEYLLLSAHNSTIILKLEEFALVDVTNVMNIEKNVSTKSAFNLKNSGHFVHVTTDKITLFDLSKIDSAGAGFVLSEYINQDDEWDIVSNCDHHLICYSKASKSINIFLLKHRPRDINLVVPIAEVLIEDMQIKSEISSIYAQISDAHICMFLGCISGHIHRVVFDHSCNIIDYKSIYIDSPIESMELYSNYNSFKIYVGTRYGVLYLVDFQDLSFFKLEQLGIAPVKITKFIDGTLMSFNFDSSFLLKENDKECIKRKILNWASETAVELIYRLGKVYIAGIKDDALFLMTIPPISKNSLSKQMLISGSKISSFSALKSGKWIISCNNLIDKKVFIKCFDSNGSELCSHDQGFNESICILTIDDGQKLFLVASTTKDKMQSKFEILSFESNKLEIKNEYVFEGAVSKVKLDCK